ncbi:MAG TPA: CPBP family glutamic-type intramembrane protease [Fimbriimonadales bacterium]|nr:CPBP family glutamic-type intramembrane protease [Fimbriimonadales bacterium]
MNENENFSKSEEWIPEPYEPPPSPRMPTAPWAWWLLAFSFLALASLITLTFFFPGPFKKDTRELIQKLNSYEKNLESMERDDATIKKIVADIRSRKWETKGAKGEAARVLLVLSQALSSPPKPDFRNLNAETDDIETKSLKEELEKQREALNEALRKIYSSKTLSLSEAHKLAQTLAANRITDFPYEWAIEEAYKRAGITREELIEERVMPGIGFLFFSGLVCWTFYFSLRRRGFLKPKGIPLEGESLQTADSLGIRALVGLALSIVGPAVFGYPFSFFIPPIWAIFIGEAIAIFLFVLYLRKPVLGVSFPLSHLGIHKPKMSDLLWGIWGFFANFPIIFVAFFVSQYLFNWLPSEQHPVFRELFTPRTLFPAFLNAAILAPILEEIFFRGCIFQGLSLRLKKVGAAIFFSSLAFAVVHPQGGQLWLVLGWIGAMGAILTWQTGSLVAAIVMHALHNTTVILAALYAPVSMVYPWYPR